MSVEDKIQQMEQALYSAQLTSDVAALDNLMENDLLFTDPAGQLFTKEQDLAMHRSGGFKIFTLTPTETTIKVLTPTVAVASVVAKIEGTIAGEPANGTFRYMRVWLERDGRWRITAGSMAVMLQGG